MGLGLCERGLRSAKEALNWGKRGLSSGEWGWNWERGSSLGEWGSLTVYLEATLGYRRPNDLVRKIREDLRANRAGARSGMAKSVAWQAPVEMRSNSSATCW